VLGLALLAVLLVYVGARARTPSTRVSIDAAGVVDIRTADSHHSFDLQQPATEVEVVGEPGSRGWEVRFVRRSLPPVVITAKTVDPEAFTRALRTWRPTA